MALVQSQQLTASGLSKALRPLLFYGMRGWRMPYGQARYRPGRNADAVLPSAAFSLNPIAASKEIS